MKRKRKAKGERAERIHGLPADAREVYSDGLVTIYICNNGAVLATRKETAVYRLIKGV